MNIKKQICWGFALLAVISSCKKDKTPGSQNSVDVYIAGLTLAKNGRYVATYWKNGVPVKLTDSTTNAEANAIAVQGNDVYVAGSINSISQTGPATAVYWKNGVLTKLTDGSLNAKAYGIALQGNNVYVVGNADVPYPGSVYGITKPTYWKNNVATTLPQSMGFFSLSSSNIVTQGSDVYILGNYDAPPPDYIPGVIYWKNGVLTMFYDTTSRFSGASSILVADNNVYLAGGGVSATDKSINAAYWKNGIMTKVASDGFLGAGASSIAVEDGNIYLAGLTNDTGGHEHGGQIYYMATYWKNGVATKLSTNHSTTSAIAVNHGDVYVVGYDTYGVVLWKNGVETIVSKGTNDYSTGMVIVPR